MTNPEIVLRAYLQLAQNFGPAFVLWALAAWAMREGGR
jgi:hypothetical protein